MKKIAYIILFFGFIFLLWVYGLVNRVYKITFEIDGDVVLMTEVRSGNRIKKPFDNFSSSDDEDITWFVDFELTQEFDFNTKVYENINVYGKLTKIEQHFKVVFVDINDIQIGSVQYILKGSDATAPEAPTLEGHKFIKWDQVYTNVNQDLVIKPVYDIYEFEVIFLDYDDTILSKQFVLYNKAAVAPSDPTREGYNFTGWSDSFDHVTSNIIIFANYEAKTFNVTFNTFGGEIIEDKTYSYGEILEQQIAVKEGYYFLGWYLDDEFKELYNYSNKITQDLTLYAKFVLVVDELETYNVRFVDSNNNLIGDVQQIPLGGNAFAPEVPDLTGHTFLRWDKSFNNVQSDLTVKTIYQINTYVITFLDYNGYILFIDNVEYNQSATAPITPDREGYDFDGWSKDFVEITSDLIVNALYKIKKYIVSFVDINNELIGEVQSINFGESALAPNAPDLVGHKFVKWDKDFTIISEDLLIKPIYQINIYDIIFLDYDGSLIEKQEVSYMSDAIAPNDPERIGYNFTAWNKSFLKVTTNLIIIAEYEAKEFTVSFETFGGEVIEDKTYFYGDVLEQQLAVKEGNHFLGWYLDEQFTLVYNFVNKITKSLKLYAKFVTIEEEIEFFDVSFVDFNNNLIGETQKIPSGGNAFAPSAPEVIGYTFVKWEISYINVKSDLIVKAIYELSIYQVKFVNYDYELLSSQQVQYKQAASEPETPIRVGYNFIGWSESFNEIYNDLIIVAEYEIKIFNVLFIDSNNRPIGPAYYTKYGENAVAPNAPDLPGHTFSHWNKSFNNVQSDLLVKAIYEINVYNVTFTDYDGTVLFTEEVQYNQSATKPITPTREGYDFSNWSQSFENVTENIVVIAQYVIKVFTVNFIGYNNEQLEEEQIVNYGGNAIEPNVPNVEGFIFVKWDQSFNNIKTNLTIKAVYKIKTYNLIFVDFDGKVIEVQEVEYKGSGTEPAEPSREGYNFTGWNIAFDYVTSDLIIVAQYESQEFTVIFTDMFGNNIGEPQLIKYGSSALAPDAPVFAGYTFVNWDKKFNKVKSDLIIQAMYKVNEYEVTFLNYDGSEYAKQKVEHNKNAVKPEDPNRLGHNFIGWSKSLLNITSDLVVVAMYEIQEFTVVFVDSNNNPIELAQTVKYGESAIAPDAPVLLGHQFSKWDIPFNSVKGNLTVKAIYVSNVYEVTFLDYNGKHIVTRKVNYLGDVTPPSNPVRVGYNFIGWNKSFATIKENIIIIAQYQPKAIEVSIHEYSKTITTTIEYNNKASVSHLLTIGNYKFGGFYSDALKTKLISQDLNFEFKALQLDTINIYIKYNVEVKYHLHDDSVSTIVKELNSSHNLIDNSNESMKLDGWYYEKTYINRAFDELILTESVDLYGKYLVTINFESNGGSVIQPIVVQYNTKKTIELKPVYNNGLFFLNWYINEDLTVLYDSNETITQNITLYAKKGYKVQFGEQDGTNYTEIVNVIIGENEHLVRPADPLKVGYTFNGWFIDPSYNFQVDFSAYIVNSPSIKIYAQWLKNYSITYEDPQNKFSMIHNGRYSIMAITDDEKLFVLGDNNQRELSSTTDTKVNKLTEDTNHLGLQTGEKVVKIQSGLEANFWLTSHNRVLSAGQGDHNGISSSQVTKPAQMIFPELGSEDYIIDIAFSHYHGLAVSKEGKVYSWGFNTIGQIKPVLVTPILLNFGFSDDEQVEKVHVGLDSSLVITNKGNVYNWGLNNHGQLGINSINNTSQIKTKPNLNLNQNEKVVDASMGGFQTVLLTNFGRTIVYGINTNNSLLANTPNNSDVLAPVDITNRFKDAIKKVSLSDIHFAGNPTNFFLDVNNNLFSIGGDSLKLGNGTEGTLGKLHNISNNFNLSKNEMIIDVEAGDTVVSVLTSYGRILTWGSDLYGSLGSGALAPNRSLPLEIYGNKSTNIDTIFYPTNKQVDLLNPSKLGMIFDGWYKDFDPIKGIYTNKVESISSITSNMKLYAKWRREL